MSGDEGEVGIEDDSGEDELTALRRKVAEAQKREKDHEEEMKRLRMELETKAVEKAAKYVYKREELKKRERDLDSSGNMRG